MYREGRGNSEYVERRRKRKNGDRDTKGAGRIETKKGGKGESEGRERG